MSRSTTHRVRRAAVAAVAAVAGMAVAPIASHAGLDLPFSDVPEEHPYRDAITTLYSAGVVEGFGDGTYRPTAPVSRQTMAAYLARTLDLGPRVRVTSLTNAFDFPGTGWTTVPQLSTIIAVPDAPDLDSVLTARFSAESVCTGSLGWGAVRILVDGVEMSPAVGGDQAFDSSDAGAEGSNSWESHALDRTAVVSSGNHPVTVQVKESSNGVNCQIDDAVLVVQSLPVV